MAPLVIAQAAPLANCSIWSASRSRSGPTCSSTRRATTLPHPWAKRAIPVESIEDDLRKGIGCPSLDFGKERNWETWVDILPRSLERANRVLHPPGRIEAYSAIDAPGEIVIILVSASSGRRDLGDRPDGRR